MKNNLINSNYDIVSSNKFNRQLRREAKRGKDIKKISYVINSLAQGLELEPRYCDHMLKDDKTFNKCRECHIEPDWLLVYKCVDNTLYLVATGSHSDLFE